MTAQMKTTNQLLLFMDNYAYILGAEKTLGLRSRDDVD
jgi:hypothetical protein